MKRILTMLLLMPLMALAGTIGEALNCTSLTWTTGGTPSRVGEGVDWYCETGDSYSDGMCAQSGVGGAGDATSWLKTTIVGPAKISYRYKVQTYNGSFTVTRGSVSLYSYSGVTGTSASWQYAEYDIPSGTCELKFEYHHPGMGYVNQLNGVRIDNFTVTYNRTLASALGTDNLTFTTGGNANWFVQTAEKHDGQDAVRSGAIGNSQSSWMQTTITGAKQVSFWWKVSSESNYDFLKFYVDGVEKKSISGTGGNWSQETVQVTGTGTHTLKWQYSKDGSVNNGSDCGWVDQLVVDEIDWNLPTWDAGVWHDGDWQSAGDSNLLAGLLPISITGNDPWLVETDQDPVHLTDGTVSSDDVDGYYEIANDATLVYELAHLSNINEIRIFAAWRDSYRNGASLSGVYCSTDGVVWSLIANSSITVPSSSAERHYAAFSAPNGRTVANGVKYIKFVFGQQDNDYCGYAEIEIVGQETDAGVSYYVNGTTGSDEYSGLNANAAKKTIQAAIDAASAGSTIHVAAGTYVENVSVTKSSLTLVGERDLTTIIDGNNTGHTITMYAGAENCILDGFVVQNGKATNSGNTYGGGIDCNVRATIRNCIVRNNGASQYFSGGLHCGGSACDVSVYNCLFVGNSVRCSGGAVLSDGEANVILDRCTIYNNTCSSWNQIGGVSVANSARATVKNSIVWGNSSAQFGSYSGARSGTLTATYCCVQNGWTGSGNISDDPQFADTEFDFVLQRSSPCRGAGQNGIDMGFSRELMQSSDDGLVAWYKFDGDASDSSGNGNNGVVHGATLTADRFGNANRAYSFDDEKYIEVADNALLRSVGNVVTIAAWINPTAWDDNGYEWMTLLCKGDTDTVNRNLAFSFNRYRGLETAQQDDLISLSAVPCMNQWQHVAYASDGSNVKVYINGQLVGSRATSWKSSQNNFPLTIGRDDAGGIEYFHGSMDDIRIYNRALTATEISAIYNEGNDDPTVYHVVTFNANGGAAVSSRRVEDGAAVGTLPTATKNGAEFLGWFTAATGGTQVTATRTITEDVTFYAHWREISLSDAIGGGAYVIMTGGDGNWFAEGANKVEGAYAAQSGAIGDGQTSWMQTTVTGANDVSFKWMVSSEEEYDWLKVYVDGVEKDAISGSVSWREKTLSITDDGAHVIKWVYSKDGSVSNGDDCGRVDALTVTPIVTPPPVVEWTVTFNANGGTASFAEKSVVDGQAVGSLPTAEREGFDFDGWYTASLGGSEVTAATVVTVDVEYFAHWRSVEVVPTYGPWGESSAVKNPDKLGPTYLQNMSVTIYGSPAEEGDVVAVYREDTDALCGLGKVMDSSGRVTLVYYAPKGTILTFKVWLGASGVTNPTILNCDATCNLEAPDVGLFYSGHALRVTDDESLTITLADEDWHCISFNVAPDDASPSVVFGDVANKIAAVTQGIDFWMPGQPSSLKKIEIGKGYWVKTTAENVSWTVYGKTVPDTEIELEAGWNLVGYAGERSGRIAQVMRAAIADGVVGYITCGIEFYPGGTLATMEPGKAYWVYASEPYTLKYDAPRALMMAKAMAVENAAALTEGAVPVPTYGPWGESDAVKNPDKLASTMLLSMPLTFDDDDAEEGDVVAAYRQDTGALCGLGKVLDDSGTLTMVCYAPKGVMIHFKAWVAASGINEPQIFDCDEDSDLIAPEVGAFVNGHELVVSTEDELLTVVPGAKVDLDTGLIGYTPNGLPSGLKYDKNTGRITGSASKPTGTDGVVVSFTKSGAQTETLTLIVAPIPKIEIALLGDTDGCKVTGAGSYLVGKKASLSATAPKGTAFIGWFRAGEAWPNATDSAKAKLSYEMTAEDMSIVAKFEKEKMSVGCAGLSFGTFVAGVAGAASGIPLEIETQSGVKSVAVKFTPACGLSYDAKKQLITGAPTKTGEVKVEITVTSVSGAVEKKTIAITVAALPEMAVGTFNGFVGKTAQEEFNGHGTFTLTTTDAGKLTAKVVDATGSYSFSAASWDSISAGVCTAKLSTKKGEVLNLSLNTTAAWNAYQLTGTFAANGKTYEVSAQRKAFGTPWYFTATGDAENGWTLGYAVSAKESVLTVTMKADGTTALAGTLGGNKISASGFVDVSGMTNGVLFADFVPVVSVKTGKSTMKKSLYIRTNLWFDRNAEHEAGTGSAVFVK